MTTPTDLTPLTPTAQADLEARVLDSLPADLPAGASWSVTLLEDEDVAEIEGVAVQLRQEAPGIDPALADYDEHVRRWADAEEAADLTHLGLAFHASGGLGGPWHEGGRTYVGGTWQYWYTQPR